MLVLDLCAFLQAAAAAIVTNPPARAKDHSALFLGALEPVVRMEYVRVVAAYQMAVSAQTVREMVYALAFDAFRWVVWVWVC